MTLPPRLPTFRLVVKLHAQLPGSGTSYELFVVLQVVMASALGCFRALDDPCMPRECLVPRGSEANSCQHPAHQIMASPAVAGRAAPLHARVVGGTVR